jgi:sulfopyruvate decarboxylase subunit beta
MTMSLGACVAAVRAARDGNDIVITSMGSSREWMALGPPHPHDLVYVPSSMGLAPSVGLGLALACRERRVVVCNGDGSMLMNLGALVSITAAGAANLVLLVFDNGVYEVTGAQPTPGNASGRVDATPIDWVEIARGCGFRAVSRYAELEAWQRDVHQVLRAPGPSFTVLDIAPIPNAIGPRSPGPGGERARRFMAALGSREQPGDHARAEESG